MDILHLILAALLAGSLVLRRRAGACCSRKGGVTVEQWNERLAANRRRNTRGA